jgi:hypothetical protein
MRFFNAFAVVLIASVLPDAGNATARATTQNWYPLIPVSEVCKVQVNNPHFSDGTGGVIYKTRVKCAATRTALIGPALYVCPVDPTGPEGTWPEQGCVFKGADVQSRVINPGKVETFYYPRLGQPGARGSGLWVGNTAGSTKEEGPGGH